MRAELLELVKQIPTTSYRVSNELPYSNSDNPLYLKNPKTIYVDQPQTQVELLLKVLNQVNVYNQVTTIRIYFANDAKQQPRDQLTTLLALTQIKDQVPGSFDSRETTISNDYLNDIMITTIEYRFNTIYKE